MSMEDPQRKRDDRTRANPYHEKPPQRRNPRQKHANGANRKDQPNGAAAHPDMTHVDLRVLESFAREVQTFLGFHARASHFILRLLPPGGSGVSGSGVI